MPDSNSVAIHSYLGADVRIVTVAGAPWFVAADIAAILGYRGAPDLTRGLDDDEKGTHIVRTLGGAQTVTIISEPGLFSAILRSRVPAAKQFKRWVTHTVLPQIRRTGEYSPAPAFDPSTMDGVAMILAAANTAMERVRELEPIAAHAETFRQAEGLRQIGDVANDFKVYCSSRFPGVKVRHQDVWTHAARLGLVIRGNTTRHNQPTAQAIEAGWAKPHRSTYETKSHGDQTAVTTRLTPRGEARLWDGLCAWVAEHGSLGVAA